MITPRTLKGFRDFLPANMMPREEIIDTARRVYRSFGFAPIDTPVLELFEILNGKGGEESDRLMYQFKDNGDRHVGMRFDFATLFLSRGSGRVRTFQFNPVNPDRRRVTVSVF